MEALQTRHRKEQKDLQTKITSKKKNATKKTRKGVNDECERLERELKDRQQVEIAALAPNSLEGSTTNLSLNDPANEAGQEQNVVENTGDLDVSQSVSTKQNAAVDNGETSNHSVRKKPNRQKARLARRAADQEAQAEAAAQEAANMPDQRQQELSAMKQQIEKQGLAEMQVRPDGHCLYTACAKTIPSKAGHDYKIIRVVAADYMSSHPDDFAPFMEESIQSYTTKIKDTAEWGGHLELQAIAKAFSTNINVLHSSGQVDKIQPDKPSDAEIWLAYYKHSFGLGEHYNALTKAQAG